MRRSTQNFGLNALIASNLSDDNCKVYGAVGCLKHPDNGYNFLMGFSKYFENNDIHLSFGDKFDSVVFLFALCEDNTAVQAQPAQLLFLDHTVFMRYAFPSVAQDEPPIPPSANELVRFDTTDFLNNNRSTDQESVIADAVSFKQSASRFVNYFVSKKNDYEFEDVFRPTTVIVDDDPTQPSECNFTSSTLDIIPADGDKDASSGKKKSGLKKQKSKAEIDWAYETHVTPRKRRATTFYEPMPEVPRAQVNKKVSINMDELENELALECENKKSKKKAKETKSKSKSKQSDSKAKKTAKGGSQTEPKTPNSARAVDTSSGSISHLNFQQQPAVALVSKTQDEREEREYLRRQSLLDIDVDEKRASNAFDLAERATRMA